VRRGRRPALPHDGRRTYPLGSIHARLTHPPTHPPGPSARGVCADSARCGRGRAEGEMQVAVRRCCNISAITAARASGLFCSFLHALVCTACRHLVAGATMASHNIDFRVSKALCVTSLCRRHRAKLESFCKKPRDVTFCTNLVLCTWPTLSVIIPAPAV